MRQESSGTLQAGRGHTAARHPLSTPAGCSTTGRPTDKWRSLTQWYFSNGNDYWNENTLTVVNGNENDVDFQNENNIQNKNDVLQNL